MANLVYAWAIEHVPPDKVDDWIAELNELLPWQDQMGDAGAQIESDMFMKALQTNN